MKGESEQAERLLAQAGEILRELGGLGAGVSHLEAWVRLLAGQPALAEAPLRTDLESCGRWASRRARDDDRPARAGCVRPGAPRGGGELCRLTERSAARRTALTQAIWRGVAATDPRRAGPGDEAEALAREAVALVEPTDLLSHRGDAMLDLAEVLRHDGRTDDADRAAERRPCVVRPQGHHGETTARRDVMGARPNFIKAAIDGDSVTLRGESDPQPPGDIVHIHVVLSQGEKIANGEAAPLGADWVASVPGEGFQAGPATASGVEVRKTNSTTTTWTETVEIT